MLEYCYKLHVLISGEKHWNTFLTSDYQKCSFPIVKLGIIHIQKKKHFIFWINDDPISQAWECLDSGQIHTMGQSWHLLDSGQFLSLDK